MTNLDSVEFWDLLTDDDYQSVNLRVLHNCEHDGTVYRENDIIEVYCYEASYLMNHFPSSFEVLE